MAIVRPSVPADIPAQRQLWQLAFGDDGAYVDNFYTAYYRPERVLVLEEAGAVRAMTAWFDTAFVVPGRGKFRAAYLYAVATHPEWRGRGLAGELLARADGFFRTWDIPAVTTVPAEPSLHNFFGGNGFRECFVHGQFRYGRPAAPVPAEGELEALSPAAYAALREERLAGRAHIALSPEVMAYQAGACALAPGGGLYALDTPRGRAALCAEGMGDGSLLVKELLCPPGELENILARLPALLPRWSGLYRTPDGDTPFGMLKWLDPALDRAWDWSSAAYLGLAFD